MKLNNYKTYTAYCTKCKKVVYKSNLKNNITSCTCFENKTVCNNVFVWKCEKCLKINSPYKEVCDCSINKLTI